VSRWCRADRPRRHALQRGAYPLIPLALREAAEGDQADERDDEADQQAPDDRHDDADDHEYAPEADAAHVALCVLPCHVSSLGRCGWGLPNVGAFHPWAAGEARQRERQRYGRPAWTWSR